MDESKEGELAAKFKKVYVSGHEVAAIKDGTSIEEKRYPYQPETYTLSQLEIRKKAEENIQDMDPIAWLVRRPTIFERLTASEKSLPFNPVNKTRVEGVIWTALPDNIARVLEYLFRSKDAEERSLGSFDMDNLRNTLYDTRDTNLKLSKFTLEETSEFGHTLRAMIDYRDANTVNPRLPLTAKVKLAPFSPVGHVLYFKPCHDDTGPYIAYELRRYGPPLEFSPKRIPHHHLLNRPPLQFETTIWSRDVFTERYYPECNEYLCTSRYNYEDLWDVFKDKISQTMPIVAMDIVYNFRYNAPTLENATAEMGFYFFGQDEIGKIKPFLYSPFGPEQQEIELVLKSSDENPTNPRPFAIIAVKTSYIKDEDKDKPSAIVSTFGMLPVAVFYPRNPGM